MVIKKNKEKHILIAVCTAVSCADSSDYGRGARMALFGFGVDQILFHRKITQINGICY